MSKEIEITKELIQKAKETKSAGELKALAKENGVELGDERAAELFSGLNASGELADDELDAVVGGGCGRPNPSCLKCGGDTSKAQLNSAYNKYTCKTCGYSFYL